MIFTKIFGSKKDIANAVRDLTSTISGEVKNAYDGKGFFAGILAGQDELKKALGDTFDSSKVDDYIASLNGLSETQKIAVINSSNLTKAQKAEMLARINNTKATETETVSQVAETASQVAETGADGVDTVGNIANAESEEEVAKAKLKVAKANKIETGSQVAETGADMVDTASNLGSKSKGIGSKLKGIGSGLLSVVKKHPVATGIIAALTGGVIALNIYKKKAQAIKEAHEDAEQALEDTKKSLSEEKSELQTVNSELETTQEKIKEISSLGTLTLTEQNELIRLSNVNNQLKIQQEILENNIKLKQKEAALDAKNLLKTQIEVEYSERVIGIGDTDSYIKSHTESATYSEHAEYIASSLKDARHDYNKALQGSSSEEQQLTQDALDANIGSAAGFTSELLKIVESFKHDDGTIIEGYEDLYNEYMGMIYNIQSLTNPDMFLEIAKTITNGKSINYEKAISEAYELIYKGEFDGDKLNEDFVKALTDAGIDESTIKYIFRLKQQEYQSLIDNINKKYVPSVIPSEIPDTITEKKVTWGENGIPTVEYVETAIDEETKKQLEEKKRQVEEVNNINKTLNDYAKENPIEFQLVTSYDKDFSLLDKYIEEERIKAEKDIDYIGDYITNAILRIYNEAKAKTSDIVKVPSYVEYMSNLEKLSQGLDQLGSIYEDVRNQEDFEWSSLLNNEEFKESFGGLGEEYDNFIKTITTSPDDIEACQTAFDELASAYINESKVLKDVTKETRNATVAFLEQKGIKNAASEVDRILAQKEKELALETKYLALTHEDLVNATTESINELVKEGKITEEVANQMELLAFKKQWANKSVINTSGDIRNLAELATSSIELTRLLNALASAKAAVEAGAPIQAYESHIKEIEKKINDYLNGNFGSHLNVDPYEAPDDSGSKDGKDDKTDWIETRMSRIQRIIDNFGKTVSATWKSWEDRNDAILKQLPELENKLRNQQAAAAEYLAEANKIGLTEISPDNGIAYTTLVQNGAIDIEKIEDEKIREKVSEYQSLWEKYLEMLDGQADTEQEIVDKYNEQMDLTESKFDAKINLIESRIGVIDSLIAQEEAQGHLVSKGYYEAMLAEQTANRDALIEKKKQLEADFAYAMANSGVKEGTEQWYEWKARIIEVESAINGLNTELIETGNLIREVDWEVFDFKQERISKLTEEADYLIGLMSNEKLYDDDTGELTNYGDATAGLHATNYNVYKLQAQEYAKELAEIDKQLKEDPYDTKLLARRDEILESHRDMVNAAKDEKMAIRDMVEEGYNILIDSIQEIIDKNMEAKNSIKDLYDYEKSISEKTKNISSLEKKIASTEGDNSEEAQAQIQKWKVELEEAEQDLYETEWERQLSDEQKMLDGLVEDAQDWIDKRLENIDKLLSDIVANTNAESGTIATTLEGVAEKFNTPISSEIEKFFDTDNESAVSDFLKNFIDEETGVFKAVNGIKDGVDEMVKYLKDQADENTDGDGSDGNSGNNSGGSGDNSGNNSNNTPSDTNKNPSNDKNNTKGDGKPKVGDRVIFDNGIYYSTEYGTGKTGNQMLGKEVFITKIASSGSKRYHIGRTSKHGERNLGWVDLKQLKGYYTGSKHIDEDQWALTQERGREAIIGKDGSVYTPLAKGDMVLNNAATETFYKLINNPKLMEMLDSMIMPQIRTSTSLPNLYNKGVNNTQSVEINLGGIQMYGVNDPEKFAVQLQHALKTDRMSEKIVQSIAWDKAMGRNSLSKHRY